MQILNDKKERIGTLNGFKERKIVKTLDTGDKELSFKYPIDGNMVASLKEEYYIRTKTDEYVIRKRRTGTQFNEYTAQLNVEELEGQVFPYGFESKEQTIGACLEFAFEGTGWKVGICQITKKRTINKDEETTAWAVLQDCLSTYRCECKINSLAKIIDIYEKIGSDRGRYFVEGLNLRKLTVTSDTYDFYTRLIPLGKDGIGIEWLGKPYLENYQYSSKVKTYVWSDERYTNTTSLIEDGTAKLEEMSRPYIAYSADVIDLARQSEKYGSIFDFDIGDTVLMISKTTKTKEKQRIVKLIEYPEEPQKNTVELSNATKTFAEVQQEETDKAKSEAIKIANSSAKKTLEDGYYTKTEVETHITASKEEIELGVSKTYETKEVVEEKIKISNELTDQKLTEYSTTEEMKSAIDLKADEIDLSVSKKYETKEKVTEKINSANKLTDEKLKEYSTTEEMKSAIDLKADEIDLSVSKKYETKEKVTEKINSANKLTDEKLKEYSTTEEMKSAIDLKADEIDLSVSTKVGSNEVISKINQTSEKVAINANKISLNGAVTANSNFKINTDGSAETKALKVTGGSLSIGDNCEITNKGNVFALTPKFYSGLYLNSDFETGNLSSLNYSMLLGYIGSNVYIGKSKSTIWGYSLTANNDIYAYGTIGCLGKKSRIIQISDGRNIEMYAYETATPTFGDIGTGKLDNNGKCYIDLDENFLLTIERGMKYHIMLTAKGKGEVYVAFVDENVGYFVVEGTPKLEFYWEVKTRQKGCRDTRMEQSEIPEKEDVTEEEQEMRNEQMRNQLFIVHEMEQDEKEVQEEQINLIEKMEKIK